MVFTVHLASDRMKSHVVLCRRVRQRPSHRCLCFAAGHDNVFWLFNEAKKTFKSASGRSRQNSRHLVDGVLPFRHRLTDDQSADSAGLLTEVDVHNLGRCRREGFITDVAQLYTRGVDVGEAQLYTRGVNVGEAELHTRGVNVGEAQLHTRGVNVGSFTHGALGVNVGETAFRPSCLAQRLRNYEP